MKNTVIYHSNCFDGFGAAWVCRKALEKEGPVTYIPAKYGDAAPDVHGEYVWIVDFSYPKDVLLKLAEDNDVTVLDHHKTAQANCEGLPSNIECTFDMNRSGAMLAWDHFFPNKTAPQLIQYIQDRDLWIWKLTGSREMSALIASYPRTFAVYDDLCHQLDNDAWVDLVDQGAAILRFERQKVEEMCSEVKMVDLGDGLIPAVNVPYDFGSLCGEYLNTKYPDAPYAAYYFDRADGDQQWGLRSRGFDVSDVAKRFGGGGHKQASGFVKGKVTR